MKILVLCLLIFFIICKKSNHLIKGFLILVLFCKFINLSCYSLQCRVTVLPNWRLEFDENFLSENINHLLSSTNGLEGGDVGSIVYSRRIGLFICHFLFVFCNFLFEIKPSITLCRNNLILIPLSNFIWVMFFTLSYHRQLTFSFKPCILIKLDFIIHLFETVKRQIWFWKVLLHIDTLSQIFDRLF